jgi:hypothetical protein
MQIFNVAGQLISKLKRNGVAGSIAVAAGANPTKAEFDALVADYNKLVAALKENK